MNFSFITALSLCSFWGISISASDFQTTKVHPGEDVTLQCTNNSKMDSMTFWFRLVNSTTVRYVSRLVNSKREATYSDGFRNGKFEMTTNISTLFLKIKKVDQSDSGLYFCGFHSDRRLLFSVTHLNVGAFKDQQNLDQSESRDNDDLNYATVTFQPKAKRIQMESNVIYAATR
uniref:Ig-like domain-containing protein n=1 Tax=Astatotilapia calliptera TaxID=8154 RepID=A0A3P8Q477_ASTCA